MAIWYIVRSFGTFCDHLIYFSRFGMLHRDKSGKPVSHQELVLPAPLAFVALGEPASPAAASDPLQPAPDELLAVLVVRGAAGEILGSVQRIRAWFFKQNFACFLRGSVRPFPAF
jgi:hypothetical protein